MSKSLGTGIDPLDEIEEHGADAVRFGLLAMSSSQDVRYSAEKVKQGRDLANKLWNASRLILLRVDDVAAEPRPETVEDRWIVSRLERATAGRSPESIDGFHDVARGPRPLRRLLERGLRLVPRARQAAPVRRGVGPIRPVGDAAARARADA